ncbi:Hypothetical protein NTJ_02712 [Nesidiocoris tenuis]|uniref:Uncharacterized protein n=1 Tax=Nesidiocoris tenuis TaxID=355587 RepID=A0ABN7AC78_9HEMI|nr:Hypothetical protein NTJ_02712 [Nesidiocoris tenuis]
MSPYAHFLCAVCIIYFRIVTVYSDECENRPGDTVSCPNENDPIHFTKCCRDSSSNETVIVCCPGGPRFEDSLVMMISLCVILLCLTLSICFVVCCFWSPCPLYSVCRMNYAYGDIVAYGKEEEALSLPPDDYHKNNYTPLHVKIKAVEEE